MATPEGPLTETDLATMNDQLDLLNTVDREIAKAERAGIDMTNQKKQSSEQRQQLLKLKQAYFPGR